MAIKKTGISPDLIIHPGETINDILTSRDISQADLAILTGVTPAYVSQIVNGKKGISAKFAVALEYALGISNSFWINLQAHYDAEKIEYEKEHTITEGEINAFRQIREIVKYLRNIGRIPLRERIEEAVISVREVLQVSNLTALRELAVNGAFRMPTDVRVDPFVMGAWLRICQLQGSQNKIFDRFNRERIEELIIGIKNIMCNGKPDFREDLSDLMMQHGIDFSLVRNFRGAPVQGYITQRSDGSYQMVLTIRGAFADIFWFSLFHELGHIYNNHIGMSSKFIDYNQQSNIEVEADEFAVNALIPTDDFDAFVSRGDFGLPAIIAFAKKQGVAPYIVIGRLQKQKKIGYNMYCNEKLRYKWIN